MARHGRAVVPFGKKYKGVQVRFLPDHYLTWLAGWLAEEPEKAKRFDFLLESIQSELRHRGLMEVEVEVKQEPFVCECIYCDLEAGECPCSCHADKEKRQVRSRAIDLEELGGEL